MKRFLLLFFTFLSSIITYGQAGLGPVQNCTQAIPEICNESLYPAATSGSATANGANFNCGGNQVDENGSFYYFESATNGPLNIDITPTDVLGNPNANIDLDFICWGPFTDLTTMCNQLTAANQEDCSYLSNTVTVTENLQIPNAVSGEFYVIIIANWAPSGTSPDPTFIQFTAAGTTDAFGGAAPGDAGGTVGTPNPILFCDSDPAINLIDQLNGQPINSGSWTYNGNSVAGTFDPATDPLGTYTYTIPGSSSGNCPGDFANVTVDVFSASSISVTSTSVICSDETSFTLSGIPPVGYTSQGLGLFTNASGTTITDFDPAVYGPGIHNITYTYTPLGCQPIPIGSTITVNQAPTVLPFNENTTNPSCYGYSNGTAIVVASSGLPTYVYEWYGADPFALPSGTFNYTVTDANQCTFNSSVTLYDPLNTTSIINEYNSSCFGENDGAASITMLGGVTPPGTVSTLAYCASNPAPGFINQAATIISDVQLTGDNFDINNNTGGFDDFYEDYTSTYYADITESQTYTAYITLDDLFATSGTYPPDAVNIYIDFNIDGDFFDSDEDLGAIFIPAGSWVAGTVYPFNFTVPSTGAFGPSKMRVVCMSNANWLPIGVMGPCESPTGFNDPYFGATEDYSIVLSAPSFSATYLWDDGTTTDNISNIGPGTYYVIITDTETGCPIQDSAVITEPEEITFNPTIIDISCNTFSDGQVVLAPTGGNGGAYNINWNGNDPSALADGIYTVTVTDPSTITIDNTVACFNNTTIVMVEPAYFSADFSVSDLSICSGDPLNLELDFNSNGIAPFTINYTANGPSFSEGPVNNLGIYTFTENPLISTTYSISSIVDDNGCINQNTINNIAVNVNPLPNMNISVNPNPICVGDNSALNLNGTIGTPPYNLDYTISGANGTTTATETVGSGGFTSSVSPIITTDYTLTSVTDDSTCVSPLSTVATLVVNEIPQLITTYSTEICEGDMVQIGLDFIAGTAPFNVDYTFNGTNTSTAINFTTGELTLIATNPSNITINSITGVNCFKQVDEDIQISINTLPISILSGDGSLCDDGSFMYIKFETDSGLALYDIVYTDGNDNFTLTNIGNIDSIPTATIGTYTLVSVTDQKGCEAISLTGQANVNINPLPDVSIIAYPIITEITDPLINFIDKSTYLNSTPGIWDFADGSGQISNFGQLDHMYADTGVYNVSLTTVSDSGCTNTAYQTIIINPTFTIYIPNAFTPNNDLDNDYFLPIVDGVKEYELSIYDRQGQRVFRTEEYTNEYCNSGCKAAWDGKINNSSEFGIIGVYVYHIVITDINGKLKNYEGALTLIR